MAFTRSRLIGLAVLASGLLLLQAWILSRLPEGASESFDGSPSTFFTDRAGSQAAFLLVGQMGFAAVRWRQSFEVLDEREGEGQIMIVQAPSKPMTVREVEALSGWIDRGGHAVVAVDDVWPTQITGGRARSDPEVVHETESSTAAHDRLHDLGVRVLPLDEPWEGSVLGAEPASLSGLVARYESQPSPGARPASISALERLESGRGAIWVIGDGRAFSNGRLDSADHAVLLLELCDRAGANVVLFDEFHLGFAQQASLPVLMAEFLVLTPWGRLCLHVALTGLLALAVARRRFGPVRESRTSWTLDPVDATSGLLRRVGRASVMDELIEKWRSGDERRAR
jgi:hypothetical protein